MTRTNRMLACLGFLVLPAAAAAPEPGGLPVVLSAQPGTQLDRAARALVADELTQAARDGERPLILVGTVRLGAATDRPVLFVQLQSPRECGSAGCSTSAYAWNRGRYTRVLDGASGQVKVATTRHGGMADLVANSEHYTWNGKAYVNTRPAPAVDLRPRTPRPGR